MFCSGNQGLSHIFARFIPSRLALKTVDVRPDTPHDKHFALFGSLLAS
jgi:hypothetical protein